MSKTQAGETKSSAPAPRDQSPARRARGHWAAIAATAIALAMALTGCGSALTNSKRAPTVAASCSVTNTSPRRLTAALGWSPGDHFGYRVTSWRTKGLLPASQIAKYTAIADLKIAARIGTGLLVSSTRRTDGMSFTGVTNATAAQSKPIADLLGPLMLADANYQTDADGQIVKYVNSREISQAIDARLRSLEAAGTSDQAASIAATFKAIAGDEGLVGHATLPFDVLHAPFGIELDATSARRASSTTKFAGITIPIRVSLRMRPPRGERRCAVITMTSTADERRMSVAIARSVGRANPRFRRISFPRADMHETTRYEYDTARRLIVSAGFRRYLSLEDKSTTNVAVGTMAVDLQLLR